MIRFYFGFPRCGKTTNIIHDILKELRLIKRGKSPFKHVVTNVLTTLPDVIYLDFDCIGKYTFDDCDIYIDEASVYCDNRDWKSRTKEFISYLVMHGHYNNRISFYSQTIDGADKKIRNLSEEIYYVYKPVIIGRWVSKVVRIPNSLKFPEETGDIIMGYRKPSVIERLLSKMVFRPVYYKYFDTHADILGLPHLLEYLKYIYPGGFDGREDEEVSSDGS